MAERGDDPVIAVDVVAVDGAEGFLGSAVVRALLGQGRNVRALVLDAEADCASLRAMGAAAGGVEVVAAPLLDPSDEGVDALANALRGARAVVAARRITYQRRRDGLTFRRVHLERTTQLLAAAKKAGVARFIYAGLMGVDGKARAPLAKVEREVKALLIASGLPALYLNLPMVVGPGDEVVSRMVKKARSLSPVITFIGQGWTRAAPITCDDFAGCVAGLVALDEFPTGELDIAGPEKLTVMDIQDRLLRRMGRRKVKLHVTASLALAGAWLAERLFAILKRGEPPVTLSRVGWMLDERVPKRSAAKKLLGRRPDEFEKAFLCEFGELGIPGPAGEEPATADG